MSETSPDKLWVKRPLKDSDIDFLVYTWLTANRYSPDGIRMGAHKDNDSLKRYWLGLERIVHRLIEKTEVTVAEAEAEGSKIIVGYVVGEEDCILHYTLTRRKFQKMGVCKDLLEPFMAGHRVLYSFQPAVRNLKLPPQFSYDPFCATKWMK